MSISLSTSKSGPKSKPKLLAHTQSVTSSNQQLKTQAPEKCVSFRYIKATELAALKGEKLSLSNAKTSEATITKESPSVKSGEKSTTKSHDQLLHSILKGNNKLLQSASKSYDELLQSTSTSNDQFLQSASKSNDQLLQCTSTSNVSLISSTSTSTSKKQLNWHEFPNSDVPFLKEPVTVLESSRNYIEQYKSAVPPAVKMARTIMNMPNEHDVELVAPRSSPVNGSSDNEDDLLISDYLINNFSSIGPTNDDHYSNISTGDMIDTMERHYTNISTEHIDQMYNDNSKVRHGDTDAMPKLQAQFVYNSNQIEEHLFIPANAIRIPISQMDESVQQKMPPALKKNKSLSSLMPGEMTKDSAGLAQAQNNNNSWAVMKQSNPPSRRSSISAFNSEIKSATNRYQNDILRNIVHPDANLSPPMKIVFSKRNIDDDGLPTNVYSAKNMEQTKMRLARSLNLKSVIMKNRQVVKMPQVKVAYDDVEEDKEIGSLMRTTSVTQPDMDTKESKEENMSDLCVEPVTRCLHKKPSSVHETQDEFVNVRILSHKEKNYYEMAVKGGKLSADNPGDKYRLLSTKTVNTLEFLDTMTLACHQVTSPLQEQLKTRPGSATVSKRPFSALPIQAKKRPASATVNPTPVDGAKPPLGQQPQAWSQEKQQNVRSHSSGKPRMPSLSGTAKSTNLDRRQKLHSKSNMEQDQSWCSEGHHCENTAGESKTNELQVIQGMATVSTRPPSGKGSVDFRRKMPSGKQVKQHQRVSSAGRVRRSSLLNSVKSKLPDNGEIKAHNGVNTTIQASVTNVQEYEHWLQTTNSQQLQNSFNSHYSSLQMEASVNDTNANANELSGPTIQPPFTQTSKDVRWLGNPQRQGTQTLSETYNNTFSENQLYKYSQDATTRFSVLSGKHQTAFDADACQSEHLDMVYDRHAPAQVHYDPLKGTKIQNTSISTSDISAKNATKQNDDSTIDKGVRPCRKLTNDFDFDFSRQFASSPASVSKQYDDIVGNSPKVTKKELLKSIDHRLEDRLLRKRIEGSSTVSQVSTYAVDDMKEQDFVTMHCHDGNNLTSTNGVYTSPQLPPTDNMDVPLKIKQRSRKNQPSAAEKLAVNDTHPIVQFPKSIKEQKDVYQYATPPVTVEPRGNQLVIDTPGVQHCLDIHQELTDAGVTVPIENLTRGLLPPTQYQWKGPSYSSSHRLTQPPNSSSSLLHHPSMWLPEEARKVKAATKKADEVHKEIWREKMEARKPGSASSADSKQKFKKTIPGARKTKKS